VGHIGKDPDFRTIADGVPVISFPLVTTEFLNKNGIKTEVSEWHNVTMWRTLAEAGARQLKKGLLVYLEGKLKTRSFLDKEGIKRYVTEIAADQFIPLASLGDLVPSPEKIIG
jgi:single-strand DNA-binding protein